MNINKRVLSGALVIASVFIIAARLLHGCSHSHSRPVGMSDVAFGISPDGGHIVFSAKGRGDRDLYLLNLKTSRVLQLTKTSEYEGDPAFSPDGRSIIYTAGANGDRADHIYLRDLSGNSVRQLTAVDFNDTAPAYSADGSHVVFARNLKYNWGGLAASWGSDSVLYVMKSDGTQAHRLTGGSFYATSPKFLPDGNNIVFSGRGMYLVDRGGVRPPRRLTQESFSYGVDVSPDGKQIVFIADPSGKNYWGLLRMLLVNIDGTGRREIKTNQVALKPVFSPDGKYIYFLVETWPDGPSGTPKESLWRVGINGVNVQQVAGTGLFDDPLHWSSSSTP